MWDGTCERKSWWVNQRAPKEEVTNGSLTGWLGALFLRSISVRVTLDGLAEVELRRDHLLWKRDRGHRG